MQTDLLAEVVSDWSFFSAPPPASIPREVLTHIPTPTADLVSVIQGVRRCGKSTLLAQIMSHFQLPQSHCFFINFEDPRLAGQLNPSLLDEICAFGALRCPDPERRYYFFDEIQNVEAWPKWFHRKLERPRNEFFLVSGSNAALLSGKIASSLTGRHITTELYPFSFSEFAQATAAQATLEMFLERGGFPRAVTFENPGQLLRQYVTDIVERDVRRNLEVASPTVIMHLVKLVFEALGSETSQRSLARTLGISPDTVGTYLSACEAAYLVVCCPYFTFSEKQRLVRNRKYYPIDMALCQALVGSGRADHGKLLETMVFLHLRRHFSEVSFWRGEREVDFVVTRQVGTADGPTRGRRSITPIQVSWEGAQPRHVAAFQEFKAHFPESADGILIDRTNCASVLAILCNQGADGSSL
jgi:predicted AAA+ superfamily ATPase